MLLVPFFMRIQAGEITLSPFLCPLHRQGLLLSWRRRTSRPPVAQLEVRRVLMECLDLNEDELDKILEKREWILNPSLLTKIM